MASAGPYRHGHGTGWIVGSIRLVSVGFSSGFIWVFSGLFWMWVGYLAHLDKFFIVSFFVSIGTCLVLLGFIRFRWVSMSLIWFDWVLLGFSRCYWVILSFETSFHWFHWLILGFYWVLLDLLDLLGFFSWMWLGYLVIVVLCLIGFHWVSMSCFYRL